MKALALSLVLLCTSAAYAQDYIANNGTDSIRITEQPCPLEVLKLLPEGTRGYYQAAFAQVDGKSYIGCWAGRSDGRIHVKYADGDDGLIPMGEFRREDGV